MSLSCRVLIFLPREHPSETVGADGEHHPFFRILAAALRCPRPDLCLPLADPSRCSFLLLWGPSLRSHVTCSGAPWSLPGSIISLVHSPRAPPWSFFYPNLRHGTARTSLAPSGLRALEGRPLTPWLTPVCVDLAGTEKVTQESLCCMTGQWWVGRGRAGWSPEDQAQGRRSQL